MALDTLTSLTPLLLTAHSVSTLYMVGLIWFVQVVHYPLMAEVSEETYQRYQERHMNLTSLVVGPPMLVEAGTALGLVLVLQTGTDAVLAWIAFGCLGVVWLSTACFQVPAHTFS